MKKLSEFFKTLSQTIFDRDFWLSASGIMIACSFLSLMWFNFEWCFDTTFRPFSTWMFWPVNLLASFLLALPYMVTSRVWVQLIFQTIVDLLLLANLMYCRTYFTAIPPDSYALVGNLGDFSGAVWDSLRYVDIGFIVILALALWTVWRVKPNCINSGNCRKVYGIYVGALTIVVSLSLWAKGGFYKAYDRLVSACYTTTSGVPTYTVAGHIIFTWHENNKSVGAAELAEIDEWLTRQKEYYPIRLLPDSIQSRRNLVLILLESFETWPIGQTIGNKEITPVLNRLVNSSGTFYAPNVLTQVDAGRSSDAQLMITAGLLPMENTVYSTRFAERTYCTLPKAMAADRDALTAILSVDQKVTWNYGVVAKSFGYDRVLYREDWVQDETVKKHLSDGSFMRQSVDKLRSGLWPEGKPAMITLLTYSGHSPFEIPESLRDPEFNLEAEPIDDTLKNYLYAAHYTDAQLATLLNYLQSRADWDKTLVVITGDHEGLASRRHDIRSDSPRQAELVDAGQHTPLIILNSPIAGRYDATMGQIDIYPTLLYLLGLDNYPWRGVGQNVFDSEKIPAAISSMTRQTEGSTAGFAPDRIDHWQRARHISDLIIRADRLKSL